MLDMGLHSISHEMEHDLLEYVSLTYGQLEHPIIISCILQAPKLSQRLLKRGHVWCMLQCRKAGTSISSIAKQAGCSRSVVNSILKKQASGKPIEDAPKSGRPSAFKEEQLQKLKNMAISSTSKEIAAQSSSVFDKHISSRTVCRTLKKSE